MVAKSTEACILPFKNGQFMSMRRFFYMPVMALILFCCQEPDQPPNNFSDPVLVQIADFQDRRLADSLYPFFHHAQAVYRRHAVRAFGSLQDDGHVDRIGKLLLMDSDALVRKAAAFALGQIQHADCERILLGALVKEKTPEVTFEILQAYGKTARRWQLDPTPFLSDTLKTAGLSWSLYRAGIRGKTDSVANAVAVRLLDTRHSDNARLGAAHFFARGATLFQNALNTLIGTSLKDPSAEVRMAAVLALGKIATDTCQSTLKFVIKNDTDTRVVVNAIRAMHSFPYYEIKHYLYEALAHKDVNVGITASEVILQVVPQEDWIEVSSLTNQVANWRIEANLYAAALKAGQNDDLAAEIQRRYAEVSEPYHRAALLQSLKDYPTANGFVAAELRKAETLVVRSAAAVTLGGMSQSESFRPALAPHFANLYRDLVEESEDPAVLGSIAAALADSAAGFRKHLSDASFLMAAREKLTLPEDNEALQSIAAAVARLEANSISEPVENTFNHPIDWELVKAIPENQRAIIKTSRGSIIIQLLVNESPGSVANFVSLAKRNYFDQRPVHRVVPNFVIQEGCKRGDGWGSEDYSLRSEFSPRTYRTGTVGMASAGKDTEGTQWFITHSPTPHLDGRYTIFGEVIEGQSVVDFIQVGDKITDVEIGHFTDQ
jgi:cyclophilin family peptidyl-prolyl cis-trans isomerase/HEAT repeat protein